MAQDHQPTDHHTMNNPSFHEELAAHLDGQAAPKPHPKTYQHGYPKGGECCTGSCNQGRTCPARSADDLRKFGLSDGREDERTGARLLVAYFVLALIGVAVGLVRGCAS